MAQKCVHKGCGKMFTDPKEPCVYHPGPPEFHEGLKGWMCCKPRVLTFDEFLEIAPCTTGKHSTVDETASPPPKPNATKQELDVPITKPIATFEDSSKTSTTASKTSSLAAAIAPPQPPRSPAPAPDLTEESDPEDAVIPKAASCKRRGCGKSFGSEIKRADEQCVHHPGVALFHEGSKGWTCCKRRVLEFDEFLAIPGCLTRKRHLYVGQPKAPASSEEKLESVRHDFYQTASTVIVSMYLKKIDKAHAKVQFSDNEVSLNLPTSDGKRYEAVVPLFGKIVTEGCKYKVMGTKLELELAKADGASWPVLRSDERVTGEIIQVGKAGRA